MSNWEKCTDNAQKCVFNGCNNTADYQRNEIECYCSLHHKEFIEYVKKIHGTYDQHANNVLHTFLHNDKHSIINSIMTWTRCADDEIKDIIEVAVENAGKIIKTTEIESIDNSQFIVKLLVRITYEYNKLLILYPLIAVDRKSHEELVSYVNDKISEWTNLYNSSKEARTKFINKGESIVYDELNNRFKFNIDNQIEDDILIEYGKIVFTYETIETSLLLLLLELQSNMSINDRSTLINILEDDVDYSIEFIRSTIDAIRSSYINNQYA